MPRMLSAGLLLTACASTVPALSVAHAVGAPRVENSSPALLQSRLDHLGPLASSLGRARAQCWIDLAKRERQQSAIHANRTPDKALRNADALIGALEQGHDSAPAEPIVTERRYPSADPLSGRPAWLADIRHIEAALDGYRDRQCETPLSACLDIAYQSVMENMEESRGGRWNHGRAEIDHALALARRVDDDLARCAGTAVAPPTPDVLPIAAPRATPAAVTQRLDADALFGFDRAALTGPGRAALDRFVTMLGQQAAVLRIRVTGHTDRLGSDAYNLALSRRRAEAVRRYLLARAVEVEIVTDGAGAAQPRVACPGTADARTVACLQPNRRVELTAEMASAAGDAASLHTGGGQS